ncbi:MAG: hypothetical protein ACI923_001463 [Flavobacteriales bacterium]|jgi:hypothetical protein
MGTKIHLHIGIRVQVIEQLNLTRFKSHYLSLMKRFFSIIGALSVMAFAACVSSNGMNEKQNSNAAKLEITSFESQDVFPGVYSNLRRTRSYIIKGGGEFTAPAVVSFLLIDSVKIPIRFISINGAKASSPKNPIEGEVLQLVLHASRNYYNDEAPQVSVAQVYEKSGYETNGKAFLEITSEKGVQYLELPAVVQLDPVYAP